MYTLPGQWLQASQGLLNSSPVHLFALAGWGWMAWNGDRRLVVAAILFVVSAVVNGTLDHWATVFTLPGRFLIAAMPALWLGLAVGIERAGRSTVGRLLLFGTLTIAWESVLITAVVPEHAYQGQNLLFRSINLFHPWDAW